jgi:putative flippase GtrA
MKQKIKDWAQNHKTLSEIIRFCIIGGFATIIDMVVMGIVLYIFQPCAYPNFFNVFVGSTYEPSQISTIIGTGVGFIIGLVFNYIFSIIFVFEDKGNSKSATGFVLFSLLSAGGLLIHLLGMYVGFGLLNINEWIVKIFLTIVVLIYNYLTRKFFICKKQKAVENE